MVPNLPLRQYAVNYGSFAGRFDLRLALGWLDHHETNDGARQPQAVHLI